MHKLQARDGRTTVANDKKTMTLNLTESEMRALEELCLKKDLSKTAVLRQALRLYQAIDLRSDRGDKLYFEDDDKLKSEVVIL
jgi:hypothetical protein